MTPEVVEQGGGMIPHLATPCHTLSTSVLSCHDDGIEGIKDNGLT